MRNGGKVPHTALIYNDLHDRNRMIASYLKRTGCRWDSTTVLSTNPDADTKFFRKLNRTNGWRRGSRALSVVDVSNILKKAKPARAILTLVGHTIDQAKRPLIVGDWLYEVYDRFEVGLEVEEAESRANMDNLICCYRRSGLASLSAKQLARTAELHHRLLLGTTTFDKEAF